MTGYVFGQRRCPVTGTARGIGNGFGFGIGNGNDLEKLAAFLSSLFLIEFLDASIE